MGDETPEQLKTRNPAKRTAIRSRGPLGARRPWGNRISGQNISKFAVDPGHQRGGAVPGESEKKKERGAAGDSGAVSAGRPAFPLVQHQPSESAQGDGTLLV